MPEKISSGIILGIFVHTWLAFLLSFIFGFGHNAIICGTVLIIIMSIWVIVSQIRKQSFVFDFSNWKINACQIILLIAIVPFFILAPWETDQGDILFLGNYSDLSFHISIISAFVHQPKFLPDYPQVAGVGMCYHFMIDFHTAILVKAGMRLFPAVKLCQTLMAISLSLLLGGFFSRLAGRKKAALIAAILFIFASNGFLNVIAAFNGISIGNSILDILKGGIYWRELKEVILFPFFNFLQPIINFLHPQRPFLFALSFALIVYRLFEVAVEEKNRRLNLFLFSAAMIGLTPLFHIHTFLILGMTLIIVTLFLIKDRKLVIRCYLLLVIAIPQILFFIAQNRISGYSGWDVHQNTVLREVPVLGSAILTRLMFWVRVCGFQFLLGYIGFFTFIGDIKSSKEQKDKLLLFFFIATIPFFLLINFYRLTPNWGDSNKFFLYQLLFLSIFAARFLVKFWAKSAWLSIGIIILVIVASIGPSSINYWGIFYPRIKSMISGQEEPGAQMLYPKGDLICAEWIKKHTAPEAIFLTSDDIVHFVPSLAGRRVVDGAYTEPTGLAKPGIKWDVRRIYSNADKNLLKKYQVDYLVVSPRERRKYGINENVFNGFEKVFNEDLRGGEYTIYKIDAGDLNK